MGIKNGLNRKNSRDEHLKDAPKRPSSPRLPFISYPKNTKISSLFSFNSNPSKEVKEINHGKFKRESVQPEEQKRNSQKFKTRPTSLIISSHSDSYPLESATPNNTKGLIGLELDKPKINHQIIKPKKTLSIIKMSQIKQAMKPSNISTSLKNHVTPEIIYDSPEEIDSLEVLATTKNNKSSIINKNIYETLDVEHNHTKGIELEPPSETNTLKYNSKHLSTTYISPSKLTKNNKHLDTAKLLPSPSNTLNTSHSLLYLPSISSAPSKVSNIYDSNSTHSENSPKKWDKMYTYFSGLIGKSRKNSIISMRFYQKNLNQALLNSVQKCIQDSKADFLPHTESHLISYGTILFFKGRQKLIKNSTAPLFVLKLICVLFSDQAGRERLDKATVLKWGLRSKELVEYTEIDSPWNPQKNIKTGGQNLRPSSYVSRVGKECWKTILKIGRNHEKDGINSKLERRKGLWFLHQFCILYGFGVIYLRISFLHLLPQLLLIANIPELACILSFNEDTVYFSEEHKMGYSRLCRSSRASNHRRKIPTRFTSEQIRARLITKNLNPLPSFNFTEQVHIRNKSRESKNPSEIVLEYIILQLMECLTRNRVPTLPVDLFGHILRNLPEFFSDKDTIIQEEFQLSVNYLTSYNSVISPDRWFREGCDQHQLALINKIGINNYIKNNPMSSKNALSSIIDPRLIASHLKYTILSLDGLVPLCVAKAIIHLLPSYPDQKTKSKIKFNKSNKLSEEKECLLPKLDIALLIKSLLMLPLFKFRMIQEIVKLSHKLLSCLIETDSSIESSSEKGSTKLYQTKDHFLPHDLAVVLPIIPTHFFTDINELKHWNYIWGQLLSWGPDFFYNPNLDVLGEISPRTLTGFEYILDIIEESGVKFFKFNSQVLSTNHALAAPDPLDGNRSISLSFNEVAYLH